MASGLVALLDPEHENAVRSIWSDFEQKLGVPGGSRTPIPHFSFHVAEGYDLDVLDDRVAAFARQHHPFVIQTSGLGIFTGQLPVMYINVVRDVRLSAYHGELWEQVTPLATGAQSYYHPSQWQPHITIAQGDITDEQFPDAIRMLYPRSFQWTIQVERLALLQDSGSGTPHTIAREYVLRGV